MQQLILHQYPELNSENATIMLSIPRSTRYSPIIQPADIKVIQGLITSITPRIIPMIFRKSEQ